MTKSTNHIVDAGDGNEVVKTTGKRQFSDAYRIQIVEEANRCTKPVAPVRASRTLREAGTAGDAAQRGVVVGHYKSEGTRPRPLRAARRGGVYYNLYVVLDIFSRYVAGWRLEHTESDKMAEDLLRTCTGDHFI